MIFSLLGVLKRPLESTISVMAFVNAGKFVGGGVGGFVAEGHITLTYDPVMLFTSGLVPVIFVEAAAGAV